MFYVIFVKINLNAVCVGGTLFEILLTSFLKVNIGFQRYPGGLLNTLMSEVTTTHVSKYKVFSISINI